MSAQEVQRRAAALMLAAIGGGGFVLAGASAIREHGLTDRPTEDVDLFGAEATREDEARTVLKVYAHVLCEGQRVDFVRRLAAAEQFDRDSGRKSTDRPSLYLGV